MNQRRRVLKVVGLGMMLTSLRGVTQAANKIYRVAFFWPNSGAIVGGTAGTLQKTLHDLGYTEGQNVIFDVRRLDGDLARLPVIAAEIVAKNPDVIVGSTTAVIRALHHATKTIPIVMTFVPDPVGAGFAASLAHPGGNVTGLSDIGSDLIAKKVELIRIIAPRATRIGVLMTNSASQQVALDAVRAAAKSAGLAVKAEQVILPQELDAAFASLTKQGVSAVIVLGGPPFSDLRTRIVALATRSKMFTLSPTRAYVDAGGLLSYGPNATHQSTLAAGYVDKILKGAKPGDLPIQQPTKLELIINRKTAKALGITLSPELLLRADEVIQ